MAKNYLAIDLGAESGRAISGSLDGDCLTLTETHRFENGPVALPGGLHWDVLHLWTEIKKGLGISSLKYDFQFESIGLDAWGVDFALLDRRNSLISNPYHYRDGRTDGMLEEAFKRMPAAEIFANTGIQFMQINTLYQLLAMRLRDEKAFEGAEKLVTIPDLFNYWLSGEITNEFTNATTTQCFDPLKRDWAAEVLQAMSIPARLFEPVTDPGVQIGVVSTQVAQESGVGRVKVVLPACHDTGSAVVAVPAENADFAWISSGTWSIIGAEVSDPLVDVSAMQSNFTNEGGVFGTWRLSKNIMGLWLVQECRREWCRQGEEISYEQVIQLAQASEPFYSVIDVDHKGFLHPGDMSARICQYCRDTHQQIPQSKGQILRVALEGIAIKYLLVLQKLEELLHKRLAVIHIIGGGSRNRLLNQFTADATGRPVVAGPVEATAIGNVLMQAIASGQLGSLADARKVVRTSFHPEVVEPNHSAGWDEAYSRLRKVMK